MPTLDMDEYEAANLLWLLRVARHTQLDTGDWCGQLRYKLEAMGDLGQANHDDHESFAAELRTHRAADLSAEEVAAIRELISYTSIDLPASARIAYQAFDRLLAGKRQVRQEAQIQ